MKKIFFTAIVALIAFGANAQTNFSGSWTIKSRQLIAGQEYANALPKSLNIQQTKDSVFVERTTVTAGNTDHISKARYALDGKPVNKDDVATHTNTKRTIHWETDKNTLVITTVVYKPGQVEQIDLTRTETWSIKENQLTIDVRSDETANPSWEIKGLFQKS